MAQQNITLYGTDSIFNGFTLLLLIYPKRASMRACDSDNAKKALVDENLTHGSNAATHSHRWRCSVYYRKFWRTRQTFGEAGESLGNLIVLDSDGKRFGLTHQNHQTLCTRDRGVE